MTSTLTPPSPTGATDLRPGRPHRIRAELLKLWTTNTWWIMGLILLVLTGLVIAANLTQAHFEIENALTPPDFREGYPPGEGPSPADIERMQRDWAEQFNLGDVLERSAANIFTSGQFFGLLFVLLLSTLLITNEFHHQTATTTFLTTPQRTRVIMAKLLAGVGLAAGIFLVTLVINLVVGTIFFAAEGQPNQLGEWSVQRAILMNLLAYAIWSVLGIGLGVLIRSQIGATVTGALLYTLGTWIAQAFFFLVYQFLIKETWWLKLQIAVPAIASQVMVSPQPVIFGYSEQDGEIVGPAWWVGALVLVGYGVVAGVLGTLITRKRDIS
jgi:ABC-type transport system involved in multi-copper enzyme maturation permease subunit